MELPTLDDIKGVLLSSKHSGGKYLKRPKEIMSDTTWSTGA